MAEGAPPPYEEVIGKKEPSPLGGYPPAPGYGSAYPPPQAGYPPPQGGYPGYQAGTTQNTVVMTQPTMTMVQVFHESPVRTICPSCRADIVTATSYTPGSFSWLICVILFLLGCIYGCCLIPFCTEGCQDVIHSCPNCQHQISRWSRM